MNIDQYRAYKQAQSQEAESQPTEETTPIENEVVNPQTSEQKAPPSENQEQVPDTQQPDGGTTPQKIVVEGIGEVSLDELKEWRNGYMRNQDYTQKTQELARQRKELEELRRQFAQPPTAPQQGQTPAVPSTQIAFDPATQKINELEAKLFDLMIEREVEALQREFPDFDAREVIPIATEKRLNLRDAYLINKATKSLSVGGGGTSQGAQTTPQIDVDELTRQIVAKLEAQRDSTSTIITSNEPPAVVPDNEPKLTNAELAFCRRQGIKPEEYAEWKKISPRKGG